MGTKLEFKPDILGFLCNWCCYAGADLCGVSRFQYPPYIKVVRVMCSGRVDLSFILRAFLNGKDGVFMGGCWPGECHYVTEGNYHAISTMHLCKKLLELAGVNPERLRLEWVSASQGIRFAEVMNDFGKKIREMGPLGESEGVDPETLKRNLEAIQNLVPYIKLVERERLRIPANSVEAYNEFYTSAGFNRLFKESITDKFEISQLTALLRKKPRTIGELSGILGISPSAVSRCLNLVARHGLAIFDESQNRFAAALTESAVTELEKGRRMEGGCHGRRG
jgi:NADH-quinone oxidoreductase subunit E